VVFFAVMKTLAITLCAAVLMISFSSCTWLKEKYAKNESATVAYLSEKKTAPPKMNIEGLWYSPQWGAIVLNQEPGGKLTGAFQDYYSVSGVVSGKQAFIALTDDDWVEYTVELSRQSREELRGSYSPSVPFQDKDAHELVLKRIGD
jgi:hypothetical protein